MAKDSIRTELVIAVDNGSSHIKAVYDKLSETFQFPNIVSQPFGEAKYLDENMGDPLDFLDVSITSPAITDPQFRHVYVGNRAISDTGVVHEVVGSKAAQKKAQRPETIVTLLTASAYGVAKKCQAQIVKGAKRIQARVYLGTGLPVGEYVDFKDSFAEKLIGTHTVTFEKTPIFGGVTIELSVELPEGVQIDGVAAVYDMETTGKTKMSQRSFGIADIGGVDLDICFFRDGLRLDVLKPYAAKIGLNDVIEQIRQEVNNKQDLIRSAADLARRLVSKEYEVLRRGKVVLDLRPYIEKPFRTLAERAYETMLNAWDTAEYASEFWFVGGGSLILAPYLNEVNQVRDKAPIYFDEADYSQFRNARGSFVVVEASVKQQNRESAATLE